MPSLFALTLWPKYLAKLADPQLVSLRQTTWAMQRGKMIDWQGFGHIIAEIGREKEDIIGSITYTYSILNAAPLSYNTKQINNMSCNTTATAAAALPSLYLAQSLRQHHEAQSASLMDKVSNMWNQYKNKMPVRAVLMGFLGVPPQIGDDPAVTARFFIDAKEAY